MFLRYCAAAESSFHAAWRLQIDCILSYALRTRPHEFLSAGNATQVRACGGARGTPETIYTVCKVDRNWTQSTKCAPPHWTKVPQRKTERPSRGNAGVRTGIGSERHWWLAYCQLPSQQGSQSGARYHLVETPAFVVCCNRKETRATPSLVRTAVMNGQVILPNDERLHGGGHGAHCNSTFDMHGAALFRKGVLS